IEKVFSLPAALLLPVAFSHAPDEKHPRSDNHRPNRPGIGHRQRGEQRSGGEHRSDAEIDESLHGITPSVTLQIYIIIACISYNCNIILRFIGHYITIP